MSRSPVLYTSLPRDRHEYDNIDKGGHEYDDYSWDVNLRLIIVSFLLNAKTGYHNPRTRRYDVYPPEPDECYTLLIWLADKAACPR